MIFFCLQPSTLVRRAHGIVHRSGQRTRRQPSLWPHAHLSPSLELDFNHADIRDKFLLVHFCESAAPSLIFIYLTIVSRWQTLPIRISLDLYEKHIRAIFPQLPSIQRALLAARTEFLAFFPAIGKASTANSFEATSHGNGNPSSSPTLPVDLNSIIAGNS